MRKLVGLADHEGIKGVAVVQLVVAAFKIQLGLLYGCRRRGYRSDSRRLFFRADILHAHIRDAQLVENRFHDFPIGTRQDLAKHRARNLPEDYVGLAPAYPGRLEPGPEWLDADAAARTVP